ncbi:MAG: hypothetical protein COA86_05065 [Kangiella sp.]|nr:MAG: hypothetical protein COA86_05065 [Kangiella sp.]
MKKIIYVGGFELPDKNAAAHRVLSNSKIFRELGFHVILIGIDKTLKKSDGLQSFKSRWEGFECYALSYPQNIKEWLSYLVGRKELISYIKNCDDNVSAVIYYNYPSVSALRMFKTNRNKKIKNIPDITEWHSSKGEGVIFSIVKWLDTIIRIRIQSRLSDGIITTSKFMTNMYRSTGKPILELPTLYDKNVLVNENLKINEERILIYIGSPFEVNRAEKDRTTVKERLDKIVESLYRIKNDSKLNFKLKVYGVTQDDYLRVYPEHITTLQELKECVCFYGRQPYSIVIEELKKADFSVFFRDETRVNLAGFPSKLAESITCGIPVITNKLQSLQNYENKPGIFLCANGDEMKLLKHCIQMSERELKEIKSLTYLSRTFDYNEYKSFTNKFLKEI